LLGDKYARAVKVGAHAQPVMFPLADASQVDSCWRWSTG
jgi:putative glutamine amidotransferase